MQYLLGLGVLWACLLQRATDAVTRTNVNYTYQLGAAESFHPHTCRITHALSSWKFPINSTQTRTIHEGFSPGKHYIHYI